MRATCIGLFQDSTAADVDAALDAAARAYPSWRLVPAPKRAELLLAAASAPRRAEGSLRA